MAIRLAQIVTDLLQSVLQRPAKDLVDESNSPLLTQKFWAQAIYTELLHASSRFRAVREQEQKRPSNGLVKCVSPVMEKLECSMSEKQDAEAYFDSLVGGRRESSGRCCLY